MKTARDRLLATVDSDAKAYLLGWLASTGGIGRRRIEVDADGEDEALVRAMRDAVLPEAGSHSRPHIDVRPKKSRTRVGFTLASEATVADARRWLQVAPGRKVRSEMAFPELDGDALRWAFLRGYFDGDGTITSVPKGGRSEPYPRCAITSRSPALLDAVHAFCQVPGQRGDEELAWAGSNALDFLARLYDHAPATLSAGRKRAGYLAWCSWVTGLSSARRDARSLVFRWVKCLPDAKAPMKAHASDSGYDLTLVEAAHAVGRVQFFRTGIKIQPAFGWYFDLVPRSSIAKTGYILANSVGVIDRSYVGEVLVPLIKIDPAAPDLVLPSRTVQIIPRPIVHGDFLEVASLDESRRGAGGFGSTGAS